LLIYYDYDNVHLTFSFSLIPTPKEYLENDFEVGHYLKERVIPRAVLYYTGEIDEIDDAEDNDDEEIADYKAEIYDYQNERGGNEDCANEIEDMMSS
jgi:hypothetical protein